MMVHFKVLKKTDICWKFDALIWQRTIAWCLPIKRTLKFMFMPNTSSYLFAAKMWVEETLLQGLGTHYRHCSSYTGLHHHLIVEEKSFTPTKIYKEIA